MRNPALPLALIALMLVLPSPSGAQENPLLSPPPGLIGAPPAANPTNVERDRMRTDMTRPAPGMDATPPVDPMQARALNERRLDADRMQRVLQDLPPPPAPVPPDAGPYPPRIDPPAPRITHGRAPGKPTPLQSSPVPDHKPEPPNP